MSFQQKPFASFNQTQNSTWKPSITIPPTTTSNNGFTLNQTGTTATTATAVNNGFAWNQSATSATTPVINGFGWNQTPTTPTAPIDQMVHCLQESKNVQLEMLQELKNLSMKFGSSTSPINSLFKPVHNEVFCDICKKTNIQGIRYKCLFCKNFDMCEDCEAKNNLHDPYHVFIKIKDTATFHSVMAHKPLLFDRQP